GVMEAALRSAYFLATGELPGADAFSDVRGEADKRIEASFKVGDTLVRTAVVSGLGNARALIEDVRAGRAEYDFVEVMACPGGCAGGGGQPISLCGSRAGEIADNLRRLDKTNKIRFSHENPDVKALYQDYLGAPLGEESHHLLHTDHFGWEMPPRMI
ncbi:MAG: iron hydrogenase small subunit, partial [Oscillospiraceae bacterium]|nr:iron hydrogenase small subunit [Oscillospiraceae bacterium]